MPKKNGREARSIWEKDVDENRQGEKKKDNEKG